MRTLLPAILAFLSSLPVTAQQPNIVFVLTDDQGPDLVQYMPWLSSKPASKWVEFDSAFLNTPLCCPSRATILSGQYSHVTGVENNSGANGGAAFDPSSSIATWLSAAGYSTALMGKYLNEFPFGLGSHVPPGWDEWRAFNSSNIGYYNYNLHENGTPVSYGSSAAGYSTDVLRDHALAWLTNVPEPFFLYFAPYAPHNPRTPAPRHAGALPGLTAPHSPNWNEADVSDKPGWVKKLKLITSGQSATIDAAFRDSARTLLAVDEAIQAIYDLLATRGVLQNTVIIFQTDNGWSFGSHRYWSAAAAAKRCQYEECISTPLLAYVPWAAGNSIVTDLVSNVDLAPTFAELAGATPTLAVDGLSLVPFLSGRQPPTWRDGVLLRWIGGDGVGAYWAIRTQEWKYVEVGSAGFTELYDLVADPFELVNRSGEPAYATIETDLDAQLEALKP